MAEFLLSDYFGAHGGAADDSTDCTAALQAALDDAYVANGGTIKFPRGICKLAGDVTKDFFGHEGIIIFEGDGDAAIRFSGSGFNRVAITTMPTVIIRDLIVLGTLASTYDSDHAVFFFGSTDDVIVERTQFLGLAVKDTSERGVLFTNGLLSMRNTTFSGCVGLSPDSGVVRLDGFRGANLENITFLDYGAYKGIGYSKNGSAGYAWIMATNAITESQAKAQSYLSVRGATFDEGANNPIYASGVNFVDIQNASNNTKGIGNGFYIKDAIHARIRDSFAGYTLIAQPHYAAILENVRSAEIENLITNHEVRHLQLLGTTGKVKVSNSYHVIDDLDASESPLSIVNTANADLEIDGIKRSGSIVQVGE